MQFNTTATTQSGYFVYTFAAVVIRPSPVSSLIYGVLRATSTYPPALNIDPLQSNTAYLIGLTGFNVANPCLNFRMKDNNV